MLLSDEEISDLWVTELDDRETVSTFSRAIQAAILAKLAAKELPEPISIGSSFAGVFLDVYLPVHLQQAHAQGFAAGAAAQLAEKPLAYFYHDASCPEMANPLLHSTLLLHSDERNSNLKNETPLYTRREA